MPMALDEIETGDIIICYGWNLVGFMQGAAKTLNRLTFGTVKTAREVVTAVPNAAWHGAHNRTPRMPGVLELGNPVAIGAGSAKANHAIIVGPPESLRRPFERPETDAEMNTRKSILEEDLRKAKLPKFVKALQAEVDNFQRKQVPDESPMSIQTVCHSTNSGFLRNAIDKYFEAHSGSVAFFRLVAGDSIYPLNAGTVARRWADRLLGEDVNPETTPPASNYSKPKAFFSALESHAFGPGASQRAAVYRTHKDRFGGPPGDGSTPQNPKQKGFFCSMFVIACYQAVFPDDETCKEYMPLDAKNTTPMTLDGYLRTNGSPWRLVGTIP